MLDFLGSVWWLIVTLGVLVTFHEFGHYWVARRCGVKVLRFSVGFGRALWSHTARDGTEYRIAAIPLGGYVKMLDAREGDVPDELRDVEFTGKPVWKRIAIVLAGPVFNLIFAVFAFWAMFMVGRTGMVPVVATPAPQTLAAEAGFHRGDTIKSVDGQAVPTWDAVLERLSASVLEHRPLTVTVQRADGGMATVTLPLEQLPSEVRVEKALARIGLHAQPLAPVVGAVSPDMPAAKGGLRKGDVITAIGSQPVRHFSDIGKLIKSEVKTSPTLVFHILRNGKPMALDIAPAWTDPGDGGGTRWIVGVAPLPPATATVRYGPFTAFTKAVGNTWDKTALTFDMIGQMVTGQVSTRNLSGVITIARVANMSAQMGVAWFLSFLGLVSLSLGVLNLLPIPVLDGGHLLYYLIELVKGRPVSERAMIAGQFVGLTLIVALMGLALYNDILRLAS